MAEQNEVYNYKEMSEFNFKDKMAKKLGFNYISWADAWDQLKKMHPTASRKVYETESGRPYFDDGKTCWVKVSITICGDEEVEYYPILNHKNQSMSLTDVTSSDVNNAIQRGMTKAIARHGLGLYVYRGEDFPTLDVDENAAKVAADNAIKNVTTVSDEDFKNIKNKVIHEITSFYDDNAPANGKALVSDYCTNQIGKKVSEATKDDYKKLLAADAYFSNVASQLGVEIK
jgi:hypothetical protein